jgi:hypothetical protein
MRKYERAYLIVSNTYECSKCGDDVNICDNCCDKLNNEDGLCCYDNGRFHFCSYKCLKEYFDES